jgi:hypothetical protein
MRSEEVRQLYEQLTAISTFENDLQIPPQTPDRDDLIYAIGNAIQDCRNEDGRLFTAPSPWHAYFLLLKHHTDARARDGAVFFRGHNRIGLTSVAAGLYRDDISEESRRCAILAVDILAYMIEQKEILRLVTDDPFVLARAIAQHYGIPTSLLDVTLDPAVAVFFSCYAGDDEYGAAFVFDWEVCQLMDFPVVIPPVSPWSRRLTVQRGFFLNLERQGKVNVDDILYEVRFPKSYGFEVRRANSTYVPWPIDEPSVMSFIGWLDTMTSKYKSISPEIRAEIDARGTTRLLLHHQFEEMFGFSWEAMMNMDKPDPRVQQAVWSYLVASFQQAENFVNHLCVQRSGLSADRVRYLQASNWTLFDQYRQQLLELRRSGKLVEPLYDEFLTILGS